MMKISKILLGLCMALASAVTASAQDAVPATYFPYPTAPAEIPSLAGKCNYVLMHFWDFCNFKSAFSARERMNGAVGDFISFMPHASADTVHLAIDQLLGKVAKDPKGMLQLAAMVEGYTYSDTAHVYSEEIYLPFVKAVAENKKISAGDKARFAAQYKILGNTSTGMRFPDFLTFVDANGSKHKFSEVTAPNVVVIFGDPDCAECRMAKTRLAADYNINQLIDKGLLAVVAVYPEQPDDNWLGAIDTYPANWQVWALPEAYDYFALPELPSIYYLNPTRKIVGKDLNLDNIMTACLMLNQKKSQEGRQ